MPDGLGGFGLAAKVAMSVPDEGGSAWSRPGGRSNRWRDARVDDQPEEFTQSVVIKRDFWGRERHYDSRGREIKTPDVKAQKLKKAGWW